MMRYCVGRAARVVVLAMVWAATAAAAPAPSGGAAEVVAKVEATCAKTHDLSAQFRQTVTNRSLGQVQEASGRLVLKRPGQMRWEYQKPDQRLYVTDGKKLWAYNPQDKQVMVQAVETAFSSRLPLAFLAGDCHLGKAFQATLVQHAGTRAAPATALLELRPTSAEGAQAGIARMILAVNRSSGLVEQVTLFDAVGNTTVTSRRRPGRRW
jgi:outer membrane lipoprotein carrier protein